MHANLSAKTTEQNVAMLAFWMVVGLAAVGELMYLMVHTPADTLGLVESVIFLFVTVFVILVSFNWAMEYLSDVMDASPNDVKV